MGFARIISAKTYKKFAKKYGIKTNKKSLKRIAKEIYTYEKTTKSIKKGLYFI